MKTNNYKIENNVTLKGGTNGNYPFSDMTVGDSFLIKCTPKAISATRSSVFYQSRGFKIATRSVKGGLRVWLVK